MRPTVIIPVSGRSNLVQQAVDSVVSQTLKADIIIVDNSETPIKKELKNLPINTKIIRPKYPSPPGVSRNIAIKHIKSHFVAFLDSDDYWDPVFLEFSARELRNKNVVATISFSYKIYEPGITIINRLKLLIYNLIKDGMTLSLYITNRKYMHRTAPFLCQVSHMVFDLNKLNNLNFDESYKYCEDWKFVLDSLGKGNILILPKRLTYFRYSQTSNTFTIIKKKSIEKIKTYQRLTKEILSTYGNSIYLSLFKVYMEKFLIKSI